MILSRDIPVRSEQLVDHYLEGVKAGQRPSLQRIDDLKRDLTSRGKTDDVEIIQLLQEEMQRCWQQNPDDRPSMLDVKQRLYSRLARYDAATILQDVTNALCEMDVKKPSQDQFECLSLDHFAPPEFTVSTSSRVQQIQAGTSADNSQLVEATSSLSVKEQESSLIPASTSSRVQQMQAGTSADNSQLAEETSSLSVEEQKSSLIPASTSSRVEQIQAGTSPDNSQLVKAKQLVRERVEKLKENLEENIKGKNFNLAGFLKLTKRTGIANVDTMTNLQAIYNEVSSPKTEEHKIEIGDQLTDLGAVSLFLRYLEILSKKCKNYPESGNEQKCFEKVRNVCGNAARSAKFCEESGKCDLIQLFATDLRNLQNSFKDNLNIHGYYVLQAVSFIANCTVHSQSVNYVKSLNIVDLMIFYIKNTHQLKIRGDSNLASTCITILSIIADTEDTDKLLLDYDVISYMIQNLHRVLQRDDHDWDGQFAHNVVDGLCKLSENIGNSILIIRHPLALSCISTLLNKGIDYREEWNTARLVHKLASVSENKLKLVKQQSIIDGLRRIKSESTKQDAREAASSALDALNVGDE